MKTLEQKYATISEMNIDVSKGLEQFTWKQIEACGTVTQAILDFNLKGAPKPEIPETANSHKHSRTNQEPSRWARSHSSLGR